MSRATICGTVPSPRRRVVQQMVGCWGYATAAVLLCCGAAEAACCCKVSYLSPAAYYLMYLAQTSALPLERTVRSFASGRERTRQTSKQQSKAYSGRDDNPSVDAAFKPKQGHLNVLKPCHLQHEIVGKTEIIYRSTLFNFQIPTWSGTALSGMCTTLSFPNS